MLVQSIRTKLRQADKERAEKIKQKRKQDELNAIFQNQQENERMIKENSERELKLAQKQEEKRQKIRNQQSKHQKRQDQVKAMRERQKAEEHTLAMTGLQKITEKVRSSTITHRDNLNATSSKLGLRHQSMAMRLHDHTEQRNARLNQTYEDWQKKTVELHKTMQKKAKAASIYWNDYKAGK